MAWVIYDEYRLRQFDGNALDHDTPGGNGFKIALVTNSYTPDQGVHDFWNDASANEVSGTNYTAGGNVISTPTITMSGAGLLTFDAADPATWSQHASGFSNARYAILYRDTGTASTSELIAYNNFGSDKGNVSGDLTVSLDASGIWTQAR